MRNSPGNGIRLATRWDEVGFSDIVQVHDRVQAFTAAGRHIHSFHIGEPFFDTPQPIKDAACAALAANQTRYPFSSGLPALRQALVAKLASRNAIHADASEIVATAGASQGIFAAFQAVLDSGSDCLVFSPFWTPIFDMVRVTQARPLLVPIVTAQRNGIRATLEQFSTPRTRAIYWNTPNNPTGLVFTRTEAQQVADFAIEHNLIVIADEAYEDLVFDEEHVSMASLPEMAERTISCFSFSKTYAMTGWRAGYAVAKNPFIGALRKLVLYSTIGVPPFVQQAMIKALETPREEIVRMRYEYRKRRDLLVAGLNAAGLPCETPGGAFYAFPNVEIIDRHSRTAAKILLERANIATVPGTVFGAQGEGHVRFCFGLSLPQIEAGVAALHKFMA